MSRSAPGPSSLGSSAVDISNIMRAAGAAELNAATHPGAGFPPALRSFAGPGGVQGFLADPLVVGGRGCDAGHDTWLRSGLGPQDSPAWTKAIGKSSRGQHQTPQLLPGPAQGCCMPLSLCCCSLFSTVVVWCILQV